jgi:hypothetical protein
MPKTIVVIGSFQPVLPNTLYQTISGGKGTQKYISSRHPSHRFYGDTDKFRKIYHIVDTEVLKFLDSNPQLKSMLTEAYYVLNKIFATKPKL